MMRASGAASTSMASVFSASTAPRSKLAAVVRANALARPAKRFQHGQPRAAEARVCQKLRHGSRPVAVGGQDKNARAGLQMRADEIEVAAVHGEERRRAATTSRAAPPPG